MKTRYWVVLFIAMFIGIIALEFGIDRSNALPPKQTPKQNSAEVYILTNKVEALREEVKSLRFEFELDNDLKILELKEYIKRLEAVDIQLIKEDRRLRDLILLVHGKEKEKKKDG